MPPTAFENVYYKDLFVFVCSKVYLPGYNPEDEIGCDAADDGRRRLSTSGSEEFLGPLPGLDLVLQDGGQLTNAMVNFLAEMSAPSAKMSVISPGNLFSQICKKTPRFKGFQQQVSLSVRCQISGLRLTSLSYLSPFSPSFLAAFIVRISVKVALLCAVKFLVYILTRTTDTV